MAFSTNKLSTFLLILAVLGFCHLFHTSNAFCFHQEPGDRFWLKMHCHARNGTITPANSPIFGMPPCFVGTNCTVVGRHSYWTGDIRGCVSDVFCGVAHSDLLCTTMRICQGRLCNSAPKLGGGGDGIIIALGWPKWMGAMIAALFWMAIY